MILIYDHDNQGTDYWVDFVARIYDMYLLLEKVFFVFWQAEKKGEQGIKIKTFFINMFVYKLYKIVIKLTNFQEINLKIDNNSN